MANRYWSSIIGHPSSANGQPSSVIRHRSSVIDHLVRQPPPVIRHRSSVIDHLIRQRPTVIRHPSSVLLWLFKKIVSTSLCEAGHFEFVDTNMGREGSGVKNNTGNIFSMQGLISLIYFFCLGGILFEPDK